MAGLLSLPNELIAKIAAELETFKLFRATCQQINFCIVPELFSRIVIDIREERIDVSISQLEALATRSTRAGEYARIVDIRRLSPSYNLKVSGFYQCFTATHHHEESAESDLESYSPEVSWAHRKVCELLPAALRTLEGASTLVWKINKGDLKEATALVSRFSATFLPFTTVASQGVSAFDLNHASRLTRLTIACYADQTWVAGIVGASPNLVSLDLHCFRYDNDPLLPRWSRNWRTPTLHGVLSGVPRERPLQLKHLGVSDYFVRVDDEVFPHLRLLESLELSILPPIGDFDRFHYPEEEVAKSDRFSSSASDIWETVQREDIGLKSVAGPVGDALLGYLSIADNIEKLTLYGAEYNHQARDFFDHILPRHVKTLISLSIAAVPKGLWCFGNYSIDILLKCTQLTELSLTLSTSFSYGRYEIPVVDLVTGVINMATVLPNLRQLGLFWISRETIAGSHPTIFNRKPIVKDISDSVASFSPVDPAIHPQTILVGTIPSSRSSDYWYHLCADVVRLSSLLREQLAKDITAYAEVG